MAPKPRKSLGELQKSVVKFRDERDWKQFHNPKDLAISLVLEAAEVMEHFQWKNKEEMESHLQSHRKDVGEELSDVLYWVLLMANDLKVDVVKAFEEKLKKNAEKYPIEKAKGKEYSNKLRADRRNSIKKSWMYLYKRMDDLSNDTVK